MAFHKLYVSYSYPSHCHSTYRARGNRSKSGRHEAEVVAWIEAMPHGTQYVRQQRVGERRALVADRLEPHGSLRVPVAYDVLPAQRQLS